MYFPLELISPVFWRPGSVLGKDAALPSTLAKRRRRARLKTHASLWIWGQAVEEWPECPAERECDQNPANDQNMCKSTNMLIIWA
jgi:hypothetical protein